MEDAHLGPPEYGAVDTIGQNILPRYVAASFFNDMYGIGLENIVYCKDETHYFVYTAYSANKFLKRLSDNISVVIIIIISCELLTPTII